MFDNLKCYLYRDNVCGCAYDYNVYCGSFNIRTYLVIKKNGRYEFVKYGHIFKKCNVELFNKIVDIFAEGDIFHVSLWHKLNAVNNIEIKSLIKKLTDD